MDLGLTGRRVVISRRGQGPAEACAAALAAEGVEVVTDAARADVVVAVAPDNPRGARDSVLTTAAMHQAWNASVVDIAALFQKALPHMKSQRYGRLVIVAPLAAKRVTEGGDLDSLTSLGLLGMQKALSGEVGPYDITANAVLWDNQDAGDRAGIEESIANTVAWLCSDGAAYVTGVAIAVDSGRGTEMF